MQSLGFTLANTSPPTMAGMQVCRSSARQDHSAVGAASPGAEGSCDKADVFQKNLNGGVVEAEAGVEFRSPVFKTSAV